MPVASEAPNPTAATTSWLPAGPMTATRPGFLIWYTRFAHRLVLATAKAMDLKSAKEMRFMYWISARQPHRYSVSTAAENTLTNLMRTPGITLSGAYGKSIVAASYKGKPYFRTYVVPRNPRSESQ